MQTATDSPADLKAVDSQKEIARLQRRVDIAKDTINSLNSRLDDAEQQGLKLAKSLGFVNIHRAQSYIDNADEQTPYTEFIGRIESLQTDLSKERKDNEELRSQVQELLEERDALKAKVSDNSAALSALNATHHSTSQSYGVAQKQLQALQRRYDELEAVKVSAEERYKSDYRKFDQMKAYMRSEEIQELRTGLDDITKDERRQRRAEITASYRRKYQELEAAEHSKEEIIQDQSDKENQKTPVPETRKRPISLSPLHTHTPVSILPQSNMKAQPGAAAPSLPNMTVASSSRTLVASPHVPLHVKTSTTKPELPPPTGAILVPDSSDTDEAQLAQFPDSDPFSPLEITAPVLAGCSISSETTEDDSQRPVIPVKPVPKQEDRDHPQVPVKTPPPASKDHELKAPPSTQDDRKPLIMTSISPELTPRLGDRSTSSPRPRPLRLVDQRSQSKPRYSESSINTSARVDVKDEERPTKKRRVSSPGPGPSSARRSSMGEPGASAATALYVSGDTPSPRRKRGKDMSATTGRKLKGTVKDHGKGKQKELFKKEARTPVANTNARASSSKQLTDYSVFKGRGRYANDNTDGNTTINANFTIDPARNGGKNFQYDEVVRGRADRRHMEAGDCECCRDYYAQIGPMPPRLQAPLWRSPPSSPQGPKPCLRTGSAQLKEGADSDITSHKQAISRHRHHWASTSTPPSYWSIGFPSTQEVVSINEKAREMHQKKQKIVQEEANKDGGRYKKR
ncbi:hypothetical protein MVEN_00505300 [Mycena venus]|uniref:DNA endonuclease activator Ctp1 C-terminal domain-containing protein n=1 Tax=Mycena venus TaxID=2733690 RepID=A0A8H6YI77_9AGAR|nr:hypothetical protein MVEN_00505300 [Mycena venus]